MLQYLRCHKTCAPSVFLTRVPACLCALQRPDGKKMSKSALKRIRRRAAARTDGGGGGGDGDGADGEGGDE